MTTTAQLHTPTLIGLPDRMGLPTLLAMRDPARQVALVTVVALSVLGSAQAANAAPRTVQCTSQTSGYCTLTGTVSSSESVRFSVDYTASGTNSLTYSVVAGTTTVCSGTTTPSAATKTFTCTVPAGGFSLRARNDPQRTDTTRLSADY